MDVSRICAVCFSEVDLKLMCPEKMKNKEFEDCFMMYKRCFNLEFPRTNRFGRLNKMCVVCIEKLRQSYEFRKVSDLAYRRLYAHILDWHEDIGDAEEVKDIMELRANNKTEITNIKKEDLTLDQNVDPNNSENVCNVYDTQTEEIPITFEPSLMRNEIITEQSDDDEPEKIMDIIHELRKKQKNNKIKTPEEINNIDFDHDDRLSDSSTNTEEIFRATGYYSNANNVSKSCSKNQQPQLQPGALTCPVCNKKFAKHQYINVHFNSHFPSELCYICGKAISSKGYSIHLECHNDIDGTFACKPCNKVFKNKTYLRCHIKYIHEGIKCAKCYHCPAQFTSSLSRIIHMYKVHNIECKFFYCDKCELKFYTAARLRVHERRVHAKILKFFCDLCSKGFHTKSELRDHLRYKHVDEADLPHCEICGKRIASAKNLRQHLKIHNIKRLECPYCIQTFVQKMSLDRHLKRHLH